MRWVMLKIFKTRFFERWTKKERVKDSQLSDAVQEIQAGLIDADLGKGLIKKRMARDGYGKSGGYRTLIAFKKNERIVFLFGFSKNDRENIDESEEEIYKSLANHYLSMNEVILHRMISEKKLIEVNYEKSRQN
jgi:hypothetical protein